MREGIERSLERSPESGMTFQSFAKLWLETRPSDWKLSTFRSYEQMVRLHLVPRFNTMLISSIGVEEVQRYKTAKMASPKNGRGLKAKTVTNHLGALSSLMQDAVEWGYIPWNPVRRVKMPRPEPDDGKPKAWSLDEARRFMDHVQREEPFWLPLYLFTAGVGLRTGEAAALTWADIDLEERVVHIRRSLYRGKEDIPKGKRVRTDPLPVELVSLMIDHRERSTGKRVFTARDGRELTTDRIKSTYHRCIRSSGVPRIPFHGLRHTYVTLLSVHVGAPQRVVQRLAGHADIRTTERYSHVVDADMRAAVDRFPALLPVSTPGPPDSEE